ncbi:MAG: GIY-YIG nuclease family protein [Actinomycetota bacterium]|nr:GIY-YIG nuclease family protein [Actinomycetota bacterium]
MVETANLPPDGVYVLVVGACGGERIHVGAWGVLELERGWYAYVGRARRGLGARLARHFRREGKTLRWHVDYLLRGTRLEEAWVFPLEAGECETARSLEEGGASREGLERFGASDCRCSGHLLFMGGEKPRPPPGAFSIMSRKPDRK